MGIGEVSPARVLRLVLAGFLAVVGATPLLAQDSCRVALLLALDVSSSVDDADYALQRGGMAQALLAPSVQQAFLEGSGHVAIAAYQWSGQEHQHVLVPWTAVNSAQDLREISERLGKAPRHFGAFPTGMGQALAYGHWEMARAPACRRRVIDVSGDGITNDGMGPDFIYRTLDFSGITVNGLAVEGADPRVVAYYKSRVARGPLAFVEVASGYGDFERAMVRKLVRELSETTLGALQ